MAGAKYHVEHYVCRPTEQPPKQPRGESSSSRRARGAVDDRTCPNCQRIFTSVHGLAYHVGKYCSSMLVLVLVVLLF